MRFLLVIYDDGSHLHWFPMGPGHIASVLKKAGHEVVVYNQDMNHYPDEHLTQYLDKNKFDFVGLGIVAGYWQYHKLLKISEAINKSRNRPFYILGGHGPTPEPEYFLKKSGADAIVMGEGEETIVELVNALCDGRHLSSVKGIAFRDGKKVTVNKRRPLIQDIDSLPFPAYELFPVEYYRLQRMPHAASSDFVMPVLSGRGCTFKCTFCYRMDEGFRPRSSASIIDEIELLKERYRVSYITFHDELLMSSIPRIEGLCKDFIKAKLNVKWFCNGRLNYATPQILELMKKAGCVFINYGIEAMDDEVLKNMKKALTVKQIIKGIEATLAVGISPGFNIIFGNIGDSAETLRKDVEFLLKYDDHAQMRTIRPVTPFPGSPLYYYAVEKGLLKDVEDFYENKHVNSDLLTVNFTELSDKEFYRVLLEANKELMENYFKSSLSSQRKKAEKLFLEKDAAFRGFRRDWKY